MNGPMFRQMLDELQRWVHAVDLAEYVPAEKQCVIGYRTREDPHGGGVGRARHAGELWQMRGADQPVRQLRRKVNVGGLLTVTRPGPPSPWFLERIVEDEKDDNPDCPAGVKARVYRLNPELLAMAAGPARKRDTQHTTEPVMGVPSTHATYRVLTGDTTPLT